MPRVGFEPTISAGERPQTYTLDRAATGTGVHIITLHISSTTQTTHQTEKLQSIPRSIIRVNVFSPKNPNLGFIVLTGIITVRAEQFRFCIT